MKQTITPKREQKRTVTHHGEHTRTHRLNVSVCNMRHIVEYQHVDSRHIWIGWAHFAYLKTSWNASDQNVWASLSHFHVNRREIPFLSNVRIINGFGWINFPEEQYNFLDSLHNSPLNWIQCQAGRQASDQNILALLLWKCCTVDSFGGNKVNIIMMCLN